MRFSCCNDIIIRLLLLKHKPHGFYILLRIPPIALGIEVAQVEFILQSSPNMGNRTGYFAGYESFPSTWRLMIKKDAIAGEDPITLSVVHGNPIGINLGSAVGAARVERRRLPLWHFFRHSVHLRATRLVKLGLETCFPNCL